MSGESFDKMTGVTFADFAVEDAMNFSKTNKAIAAAFAEDPEVRALCPNCNELWEGTFEQISRHVESCNEAG